jgi:hypothetical protein
MEHARFAELDTIPLHQDAEQSQRVSDTALEVGSFAMHY